MRQRAAAKQVCKSDGAMLSDNTPDAQERGRKQSQAAVVAADQSKHCTCVRNAAVVTNPGGASNCLFSDLMRSIRAKS